MTGQIPSRHRTCRLGTQAWVRRGGNAVPMVEAFTPVSVIHDHPRQKPNKGGMWTSTYLGKHGSGWCQWCLDETFDCDESGTFHLWTLEVDPEARVYEVDSYADLARLCEAYPHRSHRSYGRWSDLRPHWERVAEDFDAVHLTEEGQWRTRLTHPLDLYGWDCESTLWLRWKFTDATDIGPVKVESKEMADAV